MTVVTVPVKNDSYANHDVSDLLRFVFGDSARASSDGGICIALVFFLLPIRYGGDDDGARVIGNTYDCYYFFILFRNGRRIPRETSP